MPKTFALDYETYYDSAYSLKKIPTWAYVHDERFDAYMLAVYGDDGYKWVGKPADFDWDLLNGAIVLHHNATFDGCVTLRLIKDGAVPMHTPAAMYDTADLAAYMQYPRALKQFASVVWEEEKEAAARGEKAREKMLGKKTEELCEDPEILDYAVKDAELCYRLWTEYQHKWPEEERELSRLNREAGWRGVKVDLEYVEECIDKLSMQLFEHSRDIPWDWEGKKTPLSRNEMIAHCVLVKEENPDFWFPKSFAKGDPECEKWEDEFADTYGWIGAVRSWRRKNMLLEKLKHLRDFTDREGVFHFQKKYFGAGRTGRFSGDGRFNMENMPREEMFRLLDSDGKGIKGSGFDLRRCFIARDKALGIVDYAQVEARILNWFVGNDEMIELAKTGMSIYEAYARSVGIYSGTEPLKTSDEKLYRYVKAAVLGAGYGCGHKRYVEVAKIMAGLVLTEDESKDEIDTFRANNPKIVNMWRNMGSALRTWVRAKPKKDYLVRLPSGRLLTYWSPKYHMVVDPDTNEEQAVMKSLVHYGLPTSARKVYGALIVENICQATSRDLLMMAWIALGKAGYDVLFTVHDEFVIDLKSGQTAEEAADIIVGALPEWGSHLPLDVEFQESPYFTK